jgi:hypothetical protein
MVRELRRPFMPEAVRFKLQTGPREKTGGGFTMGMAVAYIDARTAAERLNHVVGFGWSDHYGPAPVGRGLLCSIKIGDTQREDVGHADDTDSDMGVKGLYSDAFKRCAVKFGVGVSLYALPRAYVNAKQLTQRGPRWFMPDRTIEELRVKYAMWLTAEGEALFGEPLGHGDHAEAQGDVEADETAAQAVVPEPEGEPEPVTDELLRLRLKARFMGDALADKTGTDPTDMRNLVGAATSADELTRIYRSFAADLKENGGDPGSVSDNFDNAHAAAA